jgi:hypothetical protein
MQVVQNRVQPLTPLPFEMGGLSPRQLAEMVNQILFAG